MRLFIKIFCLFIIFFSISGCAKVTNSFNEISATLAHDMMKNDKDVIILDVRTSAEYMAKHIKNAINLPLDEIETSYKKVLKDYDSVILVYCKSGVRATNAAKILVDLGYTNVYMFGGIDSWDYETTKK